ncbi:envelope stress response membrane protein PspB [Moellerella wisconsensis]|uniref:Phage shock protein B n=3 Tax=Moellerella wisconsensis TaxID=158849 RepID=A0A0N0I9X1_9GAMM|nr:envelope stress response membrane protein PspB [Moellerella wisconsensis]KLN97297.1 phage shock protein [Moellerella wisconsensis]KPD02420.1 phage shock protein B [Moellerella wisconsensis ATCC 35017]UNH25409.1 envelope stress response membrane protein PspB [Moellerella wisconsensis]UNH28593.1 envelope stress response membrane protein PspB [Moellerella wisconsensis]UNH32048.1 envelope stress response membrane protein PspB [Moellerella wisconsensis]
MAYVFLVPVLLIFIIFILPVWLWLHYSRQGKGKNQLTDSEIQRLVQLAEQAKSMQQRIDTLEQILDAEHPHWRER